MSLSAGRLRHRVAIEHQQHVQNPVTGEIVVSWIALHPDVPAAIEPLSAKEFIAAQALQSQVTTRITIRHRPSLDATMRINHQGTIYNPVAFLPDAESGKEYLTALCSSGVNDG